MTAPAIETRDLTKHYGKTRAVVGLDLSVAAGEVFGFLGPNGAGKSTTIRVLLDLIRPSGGEARVLGLDSRRESVAIRRRVRYLPAEMALPDRMTGRQLVGFLEATRGGGSGARIEELAGRLELDLDRRIGAYSTGNRRKVGLVHAFSGDAELIVLDEPTSGLDPLIRQEFYALVDEARQSGQTIFLSSHNLPEVERIADRVGIIRDGELVAVAGVEELKARALRRLEIRFDEPVGRAALESVEAVTELETRDGGTVHIATVRGSVDSLIKEIARHRVASVITHGAGLEEIFLDHYRGDDS